MATYDTLVFQNEFSDNSFSYVKLNFKENIYFLHTPQIKQSFQCNIETNTNFQIRSKAHLISTLARF